MTKDADASFDPVTAARGLNGAGRQAPTGSPLAEPSSSKGEVRNGSGEEVDIASLPIRDGQELRDQLQEALKTGRVEDAQRLLKAPGAYDVTFENEEGEGSHSLLYRAARYGRTDLVAGILKRKDVNEASAAGWTPLAVAARHGHAAVVNLLLDAQANIKARSSIGSTALHFAAQNGSNSVVELLLKSGADIEERNDEGSTAIHYAARRRNPSTVELLLRLGADINAKTKYGTTGLHLAARDGCESVVRVLLDHGADVRTTRYLGSSPLSVAANSGYEGIVLQLLASGAYLPSSPEELATMSMASKPEISHVQSLLLSRLKREGSATRERLGVVLPWAVFNGCQQLVRECVRYKPDLDSKGENGMSLLHLAAWNGNEVVLKVLLDQFSQGGYTLKVELPAGSETVLHVAARCGHKAAVSTLLDGLGSQDQCIKAILAQTRYGETTLHLAAASGNRDVVEVLLGKLASAVDLDPHPILIKSAKAETALHLAAKNGHDAVVLKLLEKLEPYRLCSPAVAMTTKQGETALHLAAADGYVRVTSALLGPLSEHDQWIHAAVKENNGGYTPIAIAAERSHWNVVKLLWRTMEKMGAAESEADPLVYDRAMVTAAAYEEPGQERILRRLLQERSPPAESDAGNRTARRKPSDSWTALHWAVYHGCAIVVWWLLAKGGHSGGREMKAAQAIARDLKVWEPMEIRGAIDELLQSPPPVSGKSDYYSVKESPTLPPPSAEQEAICKGFEGVIVDFYQEKAEKYEKDETDEKDEGNERDRVRFLPIRRNVMDIIYNRGPQELMSEAQSSNRTGLDNLQKLVARITAPPSQGAADAQPKEIGDPKTQKKTEPQLLFRWVHIFANNMGWVEDLTKRIFRDNELKNEEYMPLAEFLRRSWTQLPGAEGRDYMKPQCIREIVEPKTQAKSRAERASKQGIAAGRLVHGHVVSEEDKNLTRKKKKKETEQEAPIKNVEPAGLEAAKRNQRIAIYMPYLTFAKPLPDPSALEKTETGERPRSQVGNQTDNRAEFTQRSEVCKQLREAYDGAPVHQSRTLDQYYYSSLPNTSARDNDQVVSRYLQKEGKKENIRILRVDQLWLWVIDEKTIITSSTHRVDDEDDIVHGSVNYSLIEAIAKGRQPPSSVHSMVELIISVVTGFLDEHKVEITPDSQISALQIFQESIVLVSNREAELFNNFKDKIKAIQQEINDAGRASNSSNPYDRVLDEIELLQEVKDIRDELKILKCLAEDQKRVWDEAFSDYHWDGTDGTNYIQSRRPSEAIDDILELDKEAERIQIAIDSLLDLKQKQANISEAASGLQQAKESARQGNIILVFTLVTVIFAPMSFLSSLFALDVASWPSHKGDDERGDAYAPGWIFPRIFGISAAIIIPLLAILVLPAIRPRSHRPVRPRLPPPGGGGALETDRPSGKKKVHIWTPPRWPRRKGASLRDLEQARVNQLLS